MHIRHEQTSRKATESLPLYQKARLAEYVRPPNAETRPRHQARPPVARATIAANQICPGILFACVRLCLQMCPSALSTFNILDVALASHNPGIPRREPQKLQGTPARATVY